MIDTVVSQNIEREILLSKKSVIKIQEIKKKIDASLKNNARGEDKLMMFMRLMRFR